MRRQSVVRTLLVSGLAVTLCAATASMAVAQQTGTLTGTARDAQSQRPIAGLHVSVQGTPISTLTRDNGTYLLTNVPAGTRVIEARVIGYATSTWEVTVAAGETARLDLALSPEAVALGELIVTGTIRETPRAKLPFTVAQVRGEDLPVPAPNVGQILQAKVPGVTVVQGSGRPGAPPSILLRGPTSISGSGRDQGPLFIVDGVILSASIADIDALDIEDVEIIKGAAAASMYGSRAAAGVVSIRTRRGRDMADGTIRYTLRSSMGSSDIEGRFPRLDTHFWELTPDGSRFIDGSGARSGQPCDFRGAPGWNPAEECSANPRLAGQTAAGGSRNEWNTFATNPWPRGTFDHVDQFFTGGDYRENYISAQGRHGSTNFLVSFSRNDNQGVMIGQEGQQRNNFRLNVDQAVNPDITVNASAFYSRSVQGNFGESQGNSIFGLTRMMAGVDLSSCEPGTPAGTDCIRNPEHLLLNVNPTNLESDNPLYDTLVRTDDLTRGRFLASTGVRWSPLYWFDVAGDVSYDRFDQGRFLTLPKGYRTIGASPAVNEGTLTLQDWRQEAINASVTASARFDLTSNIVNRTQLRYLVEQEDNVFNNTGGNTFAASDVPVFGNIDQETISATSSETSIRADGYFIITNFDLFDRYGLDLLVRNDGSSLFGADERRQWYNRVAAYWRVGQEPWFNLGVFDELKLHASRGTAGGRPRFAAQYETYSVSAGRITPVSLGNRALRPEHSTEIEAGLEASLASGRITTGIVFANTSTENQILTVPLPAYMGFGSQVQNVGTLESNTWELSLGATLVQTPTFSWSARLLYDNTSATITDLNRPPFRFGVPGQNMGSVFFAREGEKYGTFYGPIPAKSCDDLPAGMSCDGFVVDSNGYLVWAPNGLGENAWGTAAGMASGIGSPIMWGTPFAGMCTDRVSGERTNDCPVGNSMPDYSVSLSSSVNWRGFSLYGLLDAVQGFDVYNQPLQWSVFRRNVAMYDQSQVPEGERKPIGYFDALYGGLSGLTPNGEFVEDASFVKLRELTLRYSIPGSVLQRIGGLGVGGIQSLALNVSGRNLKTWSDYRGYDPEVSRSTGGVADEVGSGAIARVDGYNYPVFRTWTFGVDLSF
jgi:TonB-linked SusC/RagA family outer membrane protein